jgi:hypothetical protein
MIRYRKPAVTGLFCLGLIASAQVQARAQSEARGAGQPSQIPAGYIILADHHHLGVWDRLGYPAEPPSPVGRRIYRVVVLVDVVVVAILAAIVISRLWFVATPGQTSRAGRPLARLGVRSTFLAPNVRDVRLHLIIRGDPRWLLFLRCPSGRKPVVQRLEDFLRRPMMPGLLPHPLHHVDVDELDPA